MKEMIPDFEKMATFFDKKATVFIVYHGAPGNEYEQYVQGVFSTREKAEQYITKDHAMAVARNPGGNDANHQWYRSWYSITEMALDEGVS